MQTKRSPARTRRTGLEYRTQLAMRTRAARGANYTFSNSTMLLEKSFLSSSAG